MATKSNPFYQFRTPGFTGGMNGLAEMFSPTAANVKPSQIVENEAQARASNALASYRTAQAVGQTDANNAIMAPPGLLAELFMNGGRAVDDPLQVNANYQAPTQTNYDLTAKTTAGDVSSMFAPTVTAKDRIAGALQEILIRGGKPDDLAKVLGQAGYLQQAQAGTPENGMGYMPLFGSMPNQNTALTVGRQDTMSARDAAEALTQAQAVAQIQGASREAVAGINQTGAGERNDSTNTTRVTIANIGQTGAGERNDATNATRVTVAGINQTGAGERNDSTNTSREKIASERLTAPGKAGSSGKPGTVPAVSAATIKAMTGSLDGTLKSLNIKVDPDTMNGLVAEATRMTQDPTSPGFKNPMQAIDSVSRQLQNNSLPGFERSVVKNIIRADGAAVKRLPGAAPAPSPIAKPAATGGDSVAAVRERAKAALAAGKDRASVLQRLKDNGIDTTGL